MGITIILALSSFNEGTITSGPGIPLSITDLLEPSTGDLSGALPGRDEPSFLGATCKCEVTHIDEDGSLTGIVGAMVGRVCILEAAENVLLARVSDNVEIDAANDVCALLIGDGEVEVRPNDDPRYAFQGTIDIEGMLYESH